MSLRWPYYHVVPKEFKTNLAFRRKLITTANRSRYTKHEIWMACKRDLLFWINTFAFGLEPRPPDDPSERRDTRFPFITWDYQDATLTKLATCLGREDVLIEKTRDMGASWMVCLLFLWRWQFYNQETFACLSRNEALVDNVGNPDAIFSKFDFVLKCQPDWLTPRFTRKKLLLLNNDYGGVITGESTNEFAGSGGRNTGMFMDEFAKVPNDEAVWQSALSTSKCHIVVSTHLGLGTAFYKLKSSIKEQVRLHWTLHPLKREGLYKTVTGQVRSTWYDAECGRMMNAQQIKQELDIDPAGSAYQFFEDSRLRPIELAQRREPVVRGEIDYEDGTWNPREFVKAPEGRLLLYVPLDINNRPPNIPLVIGMDNSTGSGSSNSAAVGICPLTGEQVLAFTTPNMMVHEFAQYMVALCKWWKGEDGKAPLLIWETPGPGEFCGRKILEYGYVNVYYRRDDLSVKKTVAPKPGWVTTAESKKTLLEEFRHAVYTGAVKIHDREVYKEALEFVYQEGGKTVEHHGTKSSDPTGARLNHGDRVIGAALSWWVAKKKPGAPVAVKELPASCFARRRKEWESRDAD